MHQQAYSKAMTRNQQRHKHLTSQAKRSSDLSSKMSHNYIYMGLGGFGALVTLGVSASAYQQREMTLTLGRERKKRSAVDPRGMEEVAGLLPGDD